MERDNKREHHNALERNRRNHIKDNFERLKDALPMLAGEKASRSVVLNHATSFVEASHMENELLKASIESLGPEVDYLNTQLEHLTKCVKEGLSPLVKPDLVQLINTYNHASAMIKSHPATQPNLFMSNNGNIQQPSGGLINLPPLQTVTANIIPKEEHTEMSRQCDFSSDDESDDVSC